MSETIDLKPTSTFQDILSSNKNQMSKIEQFKATPVTAKQRNLAFAGMVGGGLLLTTIFAAQILSGVAALALTFATVGGGIYGWRYLKVNDPLIKQKMKNKALERMIAEARENAKVQLDNQVLSNTARLKSARESRDKMAGIISKLKAKLDPDSSTYNKKLAILSKVEEAYEQICLSLDSAYRSNKQFEQKVEEYKRMEEFSDLAQDALSIFNNVDGMNIQEMLSLEAFEEIEDNFHTSITSIENRTRDLKLKNELED